MTVEESIPRGGPHETRETFAYVIDNEVVHLAHVPKELESLVAIFSSNPTVVLVPTAQVHNVRHAWQYVNNTFLPPTE